MPGGRSGSRLRGWYCFRSAIHGSRKGLDDLQQRGLAALGFRRPQVEPRRILASGDPVGVKDPQGYGLRIVRAEYNVAPDLFNHLIKDCSAVLVGRPGLELLASKAASPFCAAASAVLYSVSSMCLSPSRLCWPLGASTWGLITPGFFLLARAWAGPHSLNRCSAPHTLQVRQHRSVHDARDQLVHAQPFQCCVRLNRSRKSAGMRVIICTGSLFVIAVGSVPRPRGAQCDFTYCDRIAVWAHPFASAPRMRSQCVAGSPLTALRAWLTSFPSSRTARSHRSLHPFAHQWAPERFLGAL